MRGSAYLALALMLGACDASPREITAWPGMTAEEFNNRNAQANVRLKVDEWDWIGISAPVDLVFAHKGRKLTFRDRKRGGGIQVATSPERFLPDGTTTEGALRIKTLAGNIGEGMESVTDLHPLLVHYCSALADMAELPDRPIPTPDEITGSLAKARKQGFVDVTVCGGNSPSFGYHIWAAHYVGNREHGGDFDRAFFHVSLIGPLPADLRSSSQEATATEPES